MLVTKNEQSVLKSAQVYIEILLKVCKFTGNNTWLSSISSKLAQTEQYIQ